MNSWKDVNYYAESNTRWVELMNLSTPELGIGWIPANVVAIPETLNNSIASQYPPNTTFIENVSEERIGEKPIEQIVFGVTSGIVLLWAVSWLWYSWHKEKLGKPRSETRRYNLVSQANGDCPNSNADAERVSGTDIMTVDEFKKRLRRFYDPVKTELEICDDFEFGRLEGNNTNAVAKIEGKDIEAVTNLLRRMYDLDLGLWSLRDTIPGETDEVERETFRIRSEAIWNEVRNIVIEWEQRLGVNPMLLDEEERQQMVAIIRLFQKPQYQQPRYRIQ
ncbi:hypothetical protein CSOJ01_12915 [Colletotrichum sojae]|uniref:Uncharacterized protein n=1 Tax=Colletotrichum sojae TaxID=2175907 RepID=A0A8H6IU34_9PEZI|nr:hypothetical protein CSOJ01_12915 [Colletotrichum sojae]